MSRIGRQPQVGGRRKLLNEQQEQEICNMVIANNAITLRQIRNAILLDNVMFQNINSISISTIDRVLKKHQMTMKQIYRVPFERNSDRVKELRYQYVHVSQLLVVYHCNTITVRHGYHFFLFCFILFTFRIQLCVTRAFCLEIVFSFSLPLFTVL